MVPRARVVGPLVDRHAVVARARRGCELAGVRLRLRPVPGFLARALRRQARWRSVRSRTVSSAAAWYSCSRRWSTCRRRRSRRRVIAAGSRASPGTCAACSARSACAVGGARRLRRRDVGRLHGRLPALPPAGRPYSGAEQPGTPAAARRGRDPATRTSASVDGPACGDDSRRSWSPCCWQRAAQPQARSGCPP